MPDSKFTRLAGILIFAGAAEFMLSMLVSEAIRPSYSVSTNYISDLGVGVSAPIFNSSIIALGILLAISAYLLMRGIDSRVFPVLIFLTGLGAAGVGIFPETTGAPHSLFALVAFLFGGLTAIYSYRLIGSIFGYLSIVLGVLSLIALVMYATGHYGALHRGGMERLIVYPTILWALGFGGCLQSGSSKAEEQASPGR